jgi:quercetin dioxygenase-like cupin family protein
MNRKVLLLTLGAAAMSALLSGGALATESPVLGAKDVKWGAAPPLLPAGVKMAVMAGDPGKTGLVSVRLKMPAGYQIPAHWHPTDEHVTVLTGTLSLGMGDKLDTSTGQTFMPGGYVVAAAHMNHFAWTKTGATVQINLMGPFELTYVNPADDPTHVKAK